MSRPNSIAAALAGILLAGGCFSVRAPEKIEVTAPDVRVGSSSDTPANVPETHTHEEAQAELRRAYAHIEDLENNNRKLRAKLDKLEKELDKLEKQRKDERKAAKRARQDDPADRETSRRDEFP